MLIAALLALLPSLPGAPADTLVVCPAAYRQALEPWLALRRDQGHRLELVEPAATAGELRRQIRLQAGAGLRHVVLVGDAVPGGVPTCLEPADVTVRFGGEPQIASDHPLADVDGDGLPDVAIGRLAADRSEKLSRLVAKISAYERQADFGLWRRQIEIVAGAGGFGPLTDSVLEVTARKLVVEGIPPAFQPNMTYGSWTSPYCPDPRRLREAAQRGLNEGCLYWVYLGHSQRRHVDRPRLLGRAWPVLESGDAARLRAAAGPPIALLLSCYAGAYDGPEDCLAEELLTAEGGPVAVFCGSRVTMPYGMTALAQELLDHAFGGECPTLGELVRRAKRDLVGRTKDTPARKTVDLLASALNPVDLARERREHALLFNLLGDPLLRLRAPLAVEMTLAAPAARGQRLAVSGRCSLEGRCLVELIGPRDRAVAPSRAAIAPATLADLDQRQRCYERANDPRLASAQAAVNDGQWQVWLDVPDDAPAVCHLRAFVEGREAHAVGALEVRLEPGPPVVQAAAASASRQ
jgi:hypothetical protein